MADEDDLSDIMMGANRGVLSERASALRSIEGAGSDAERADRYKREARVLLEQVCGVMNNAQRDGLRLTFQISPNSFGQQVVGSLDVVKPL